ncbi:GntR family transcriptional regulator [Dorea formicigenerans]|uniref:GntR family transcriptional regulator n=1 Tax=Dorea formicigenerans TaxID=39486 RepID=A0A395XPE7_9FIRM|nr:GntR family transcriptional regulator [Dorea formicigenerans]
MSKYTNLLNEQIKESLESYIIEQNLQPGDTLPSERKLAELLNANRLTVRTALKRLRNEHLIYTKQGKGTFIAPPKIIEGTSKLESFSSGWEKDGYIPTSKILEISEIEASLSICYRLQLNLGEKVFSLNRLRFLNNEPIALEHAYIPSKLVPGILKYNFETESLYSILESAYKLRLTRQEETISICHMRKNEARNLNKKEGDPAFFIKGISFNDDIPFEYCITINPADRYVLSSKMKPE